MDLAAAAEVAAGGGNGTIKTLQTFDTVRSAAAAAVETCSNVIIIRVCAR